MLRLEQKLRGAPDSVIQLAAELLYLHFLPVLSDLYPGELKRGAVRYQLRGMKDPATIPEDLTPVLDHGLVGGGIEVPYERERQFAWLLEFVRSWKQLTEETRAHALSDPWRFLVVVSSIPGHGQRLQENALLHLVFPETFERVIIGEHKERICQTFADLVDDPDANVDRCLFLIREKLSPEYGADFDFYDTEDDPSSNRLLPVRDSGARHLGT
jgi:5-methylcytosine-specific restriction enzyme B